MSEYMILAYVLVGVLVFLVMCFGVVLIMTAFDIIETTIRRLRKMTLSTKLKLQNEIDARNEAREREFAERMKKDHE